MIVYNNIYTYICNYNITYINYSYLIYTYIIYTYINISLL